MNYRLVIYKLIKRKPPVSLYDFYSSLMSNERGFANFIVHCKQLASSVIRDGSTIPTNNFISSRRTSLGLPPVKFDKEDVKKIALATDLVEILEES